MNQASMPSQLFSSLQPTDQQTVYGLVSQAGVDVTPWATRQDGSAVKNPAANSDKSFRWAFLEPGEVSVVLIWYKKFQEDETGIFYPFNSRTRALRAQEESDLNAKRRAEEMSSIVQTAMRDGLPIRAIIIDEAPSGGKRRKLDTSPWYVDSYDDSTGDYVLRRDDAAEGEDIAARNFGLVLAENEAHAGDFAWQDITGELYQFPKNYRNTIRPGQPFIYYTGTRRTNRARGPAHYFGTGFIGDVYPDPTTKHLPKSQWKWLAEITDYIPFKTDVPIRDEAGNYVETNTGTVASNYWGVGVRPIKRAQFDKIITLGGVRSISDEGSEEGAALVSGSLVEAKSDLMIGIEARTEAAHDASGSVFGTRRLSRQAKVTGDAAERLFYEFLCDAEPNPLLREQIVWVARDGTTPGYDIEDRRKPSNVVAYEVKGTTGERFLSFDLTANELRAAKALRERYVLILVTGCLGHRPQFQRIENPALCLERGSLDAVPSVFKIEHRIASHLPLGPAPH